MKHSMILSDTRYQEQMDHLVIPYLTQRMETFCLEREPGKKLYGVRYLADSPAGIILISHGFTETAEKYREMAYYFVNAGYHTYIIDHCGHGRSYRLVKDPSLVHIDRYERYVQDLLYTAEYAGKAHPDLSVNLYGHSMGGGIADAAAAYYPQDFHRVILSSPMIRPSTGNVPWVLAGLIASVCCRIGKSEAYVFGQRPYQGKEAFEDSASQSEARFSYYNDIKAQEPLFHTSAASFGWLHEAMRLNHFLQTKAWKQIHSPVLLFQAEQDAFVSEKEQQRFIARLNRQHKPILIGTDTIPFAQCIRMPDTKHEIFSSDTDILDDYWDKIIHFLSY